ncbi:MULTISPECIES: MerR family transcriptional regulator [Oceanobacillus]|uniref:MerR family transcriptional regulator n=1 Tax=Oceanobacillus aidingensis TaxID=645964 RepID=A0ABV9K084_9BACI|nr:MerR family transcriptional regulator [Oceanobacillus oncorhynchi]MDM8098750.1 MerR family transcriptional regulator [Oceanobacillus oncorhynchi]
MYTIGEFGAKTGFSTRTLRFYEELGILYPSKRNESGHRLYSLEELTILQRIQSLKFIGYSLQEIKEMLDKEEITLENFTDSLPVQRTVLVHKREELDRAIAAINHVQALLDDDFPLDWTVLTSLLHGMEFEEEQKEWMKEHFPDDFASLFTDIPKEEREKLDREWLSILAEVKRLMRENVPPHAPETQQVFLNINDLFMRLVPEDVISENIDKWEEQLESAEADDFVAPTFWSKEEEAYMEEIAKAMEQKYKESEGK